MKYQTELANGSTIASVNAIKKDTSAISIKQIMAIAKCPMVYIIVRIIDPLLFEKISFALLNIPEVNSVIY
tara:strand:- start:534 stop:746 length:213 start_codon:yes stop_codon:yes gene_type:complete